MNVPAYLELNRECEAMLSPLDEESMAALLGTAYVAQLTADAQAMLIALDERSAYDSPNFSWFASRYPRFAYIDRVAVAARARRRGHARALYRSIIERARADGHTVLCAEIYSDPPNPVSDAFHASMGFVEVGSAYLADRDKSVRYVVLAL